MEKIEKEKKPSAEGAEGEPASAKATAGKEEKKPATATPAGQQKK